MQKHATELFHWLQSGAHVYVCGAKEPMSIDVEDTLLSIIRQEGEPERPPRPKLSLKN